MEDLIRLSPSGFIHLEMALDLNYLAACAEDAWMASRETANEVANRIGNFGPKVHYSPVTVVANAKDFVTYLQTRANQTLVDPATFITDASSTSAELIAQIVGKANEKYRRLQSEGGWDNFEDFFVVGLECSGTVKAKKEFGIFVKLDGGPDGLIHVSQFPASNFADALAQADRIVVKIERIQVETRKISLSFVRKIVA